MVNEFFVSMAHRRIRFTQTSDRFREFCRDFIVHDEAEPDFTVTADPADMKRVFAAHPEMSAYSCELRYLMRQTACAISACGDIFMHGSAVAYRGRGYLFTAPSGTGKSTHTGLWLRYLGSDAVIVNGDKPIICTGGDVPEVCPTPWAGKERLYSSDSCPLDAICCLTRGTENKIRPMRQDEAVSRLFSQICIPRDREAQAHAMQAMDSLLRRVRLYVLECDISENAVRTSFEALTGLPYPGGAGEIGNAGADRPGCHERK